ncbi:hypothetical protein RFI_18826, partial [Reticulomyxa filosa]
PWEETEGGSASKKKNGKDKEKKKSIKFQVPLILHWKLESNRKNEFKTYWHWKEVQRWFTDTKRVDVAEPEPNKEWLQVRVFGYYDLWIREQVKFLGHWVDRSTFNEKFHRDYTYLSEEDRQPYVRGGRTYYLPLGWKRYALNVKKMSPGNEQTKKEGEKQKEEEEEGRKKEEDIEEWCIGYHGTDMRFLPSILRDQLVTPGTVLSMSGYQLSIPDGHITESQLHGDEDFTNNVFVSPCINYCTYPAYLRSVQLDPSSQIFTHLILMLRVKPSAIK